MQTVLIVIHLLVVIALITVVLLQRSEGGALGMGGGSGGFFTGRGQANALTRATAILATLFFITSLALTIHASYTRSQKSIFEITRRGDRARRSRQGRGAAQGDRARPAEGARKIRQPGGTVAAGTRAGTGAAAFAVSSIEFKGRPAGPCV